MRVAIFALGVLAGLAFSRVPHYADMYANHSLPPEYEGPKLRRWHNGELTEWGDNDRLN